MDTLSNKSSAVNVTDKFDVKRNEMNVQLESYLNDMILSTVNSQNEGTINAVKNNKTLKLLEKKGLIGNDHDIQTVKDAVDYIESHS